MGTPIPSNDAAFSLEELLLATGASFRGARIASVRGVESDTRAELQGRLFVALEGANFDGHEFVAEAAKRGAVAAVVARGIPAASIPQLVVPSPLNALGAISRLHRRRWAGKICAVVGSAGKTTTRATTAALLSVVDGQATHATLGNLNNRVGVPRVILGLGERHQRAVVEVGTNTRGEVAILSDVLEPDVVVLTLVDWEHAEGIGDLDAIEQEEGDAFAALGEQGIAITNGDDARARRQIQRAKTQSRLLFGRSTDCDYRILDRHLLEGTRQKITIERPRGGSVGLATSLLGEAGAKSWIAGLAAAEAMLGVPLSQTQVTDAARLLGKGESSRLEPRELGDGTLILDDSYNSNPVSVRSSIATARELAEQRRASLVLVLGEMRELGRQSSRSHIELVNVLRDSDRIIAVAGDMQLLAAEARARGIAVEFVEDAAAAAERAALRIVGGDVALVKGSRGVMLEKVVAAMVSERGELV